MHWFWAQAQRKQWHEECILLSYEMQWTVRYFLHKSREWEEGLGSGDAGRRAYAAWQVKIWLDPAQCAHEAFYEANCHYKSLM